MALPSVDSVLAPSFRRRCSPERDYRHTEEVCPGYGRGRPLLAVVPRTPSHVPLQRRTTQRELYFLPKFKPRGARRE